MWGSGRTEVNLVGRAQRLVGESEKIVRPKGSEHVWFGGCCDASDVIDGGSSCRWQETGDNGTRKVVGAPLGKGDVRVWRLFE